MLQRDSKKVLQRLMQISFCLQETKMQAGQLDIAFEGYESYWNYADKKGYSGTAIFTKHKPLSVSYGLGIDEHDHERQGYYARNGEVLPRYVLHSQRTRWFETVGLQNAMGRRLPSIRETIGREKACNSVRRLECCARGNRLKEP